VSTCTYSFFFFPTRIAQIIQERFGKDKNACFVILGDFNDTPDAERLKPLLDEMKLENVNVPLTKE
jgi:endonuclease/exonuclease/phosphatase family metal-dependent hydrolase